MTTEFKLPVFSSVVQRFSDVIQVMISTAARGEGALAQLNTHALHEGTSSQIVRGDGGEEAVDLLEASAESTMKFDDIERINVEYVVSQILDIARQFNHAQTKHLFSMLDAVTQKTGNVVDGGGAPINNQLILEMLAKMPHDFNSDGTMRTTMVVPPQVAERLPALEAELEQSPELKAQFDRILEQKRDDFRTREMDRNLAG